MKNIKNIIFDLGGVFIDIDYFKTERAFNALGVTNFHELYTQHHASSLFKDLETGKIDAETFYQRFRQQANTNLTNTQIESAWNAMLGKFINENVNLLEEIREKYIIYLFSNTNIIHYNAFQKIYSEQTGKNSFDDYFVAAYYSHDLGLRKPETKSFLAILEKEKLVAEETLFIDDTPKNIEGAKQAGLHTILLPDPGKLSRCFNDGAYLTPHE